MKLQGKSVLIIIIAALVLIAAGGTYYFTHRIPFAEQKPAVGDNAPEISLADVSGRMMTLAELKGRVVLLNFWASWCPPCVNELEEFQKVYMRHEEKDFAIIAIGIDDFHADLPRKLGITFPVAKQNPRVAKAYGDISHVPVSFLIDSNGVIVKKTNQFYSEKELVSDLQKLIGRK